jgi:uncharacterized Zn-binding protein involved in type VI secretion
MGNAAARVGDPTGHGIPLTGSGSPTVLVGGRPAWRAITPSAAGGASVAAGLSATLSASKTTSDAAIKTAEVATRTAVASGVPAAITAARSAEEATKAAASAAMSALIASTASALAGVAGGPPDVHTCSVPLPVPPHGPSLVLRGSTTVFIGGYAAARANDQITEAVGPPNSISSGDATVLIG